MVFAQYPVTAGQGVLAQMAGRLVLSQLSQSERQVWGREQGVGVVVAQHPPLAGQGVLAEPAALLVVP